MHDLSRRRLLGTAAGIAPLVLGSFPLLTPVASRAADTPGDGRRFFTLGVASGDPLPDGVVLWTRLAPDPIHGGGMGPAPVEVTWEVAADDKMQQIVKRGTVVATEDFAHSVHVEVEGLDPARWYWYRFRIAQEESRIGRTRTAPAAGVMAERLRFAAGSCQSFDTGYYTAHRYLAQEDLDLFVFLGDYIYEGNPGPGEGRRSNPQETDSLDGFRNRHAHYKTDPNLQASHAAFPWIVTWDDHEVINDYAGDNGDPAEFLKLRAAAYRAYYEHMPLRRASLPKGPDMLLYRDLSFGRLLAFDVLDTRQYRTALPCGGWRSEPCEDSLSPERTITGIEQEAWLYQRLRNSPAHWNVLAQQVPMMQRLIPDAGKLLLAMDKWDGYSASRNRLLHVLEQARTSNPIVLSGDIHSGWVGDLKSDFADEKSATIGTEFVCTSITSGGDGRPGIAVAPELLAVNPHLRLNVAQRGYARFDVSPKEWRSSFRVVDYVREPGSPMSTVGGMVIESGRPGAQFV